MCLIGVCLFFSYIFMRCFRILENYKAFFQNISSLNEILSTSIFFDRSLHKYRAGFFPECSHGKGFNIATRKRLSSIAPANFNMLSVRAPSLDLTVKYIFMNSLCYNDKLVAFSKPKRLWRK